MQTGHCHCGACRYRFDPEAILWQGICHCTDCTRASGAALVGWIGVRDGGWGWEGTPPRSYASSAAATRWFCGACGASLAFASTEFPGETHFTATTLTDPSAFEPTEHYHPQAELPWVRAVGDPSKPGYPGGG